MRVKEKRELEAFVRKTLPVIYRDIPSIFIFVKGFIGVAHMYHAAKKKELTWLKIETLTNGWFVVSISDVVGNYKGYAMESDVGIAAWSALKQASEKMPK